MDSLEYKQLVIDFQKGIYDLSDNLQLVEDGEVEGEAAATILQQAKARLAWYDEIFSQLSPWATLQKSFVNAVEYDVSLIRECLARMEAQ